MSIAKTNKDYHPFMCIVEVVNQNWWLGSSRTNMWTCTMKHLLGYQGLHWLCLKTLYPCWRCIYIYIYIPLQINLMIKHCQQRETYHAKFDSDSSRMEQISIDHMDLMIRPCYMLR